MSSRISARGRNTVAVPDKAHLTGDSLLVLVHDAGDIGTVTALARELESGRIALVAVASKRAATTAKLNTGVLVGLAP